ncbi:MAG: DUF86 domain-containing protein [Methanomicrobiales archaeon]|nr:DUF86 domain-containing protein [Methanomicrobiales archaeon]
MKPLTLRSEAIRIKLATIADSIDLVTTHLPSDLNTFKNLGIVKDGIYKRVEYSIENVLDICAIINADLKFGIPESEDDIISRLIQHNVFDKSLGEEVRQMKRFRNIVVHRYGNIDDQIAFEILIENITSFERFRLRISEFISECENIDPLDF